MNISSLSLSAHLELYFLAIFEHGDLLSPVQEVCVVDNVAPELREVEDGGVVSVQLVVSGVDESVAEAGLAWALSPQPIVAGRRQTTHGHSDGGHLALSRHLDCLGGGGGRERAHIFQIYRM